MFGKDDLKELREALAVCGCDMNAFKSWQRQYEKLMKQMPSVRGQYESALCAAQEAYETAQELERMLVEAKTVYDGSPDQETVKEFTAMLKSLKKMQGSYAHEFVISRDDREFHSTYESIVKLGAKALEQPQQRLILQSEIENLLALLKENLEREKPVLHALCFFYQEHSDMELQDLSPTARLERIGQVYRTEFTDPISKMLLECIAQADSRQEELEAAADRQAKKEAQQLKLLWNRPGEQRHSSERTKRILQELMEKGDER